MINFFWNLTNVTKHFSWKRKVAQSDKEWRAAVRLYRAVSRFATAKNTKNTKYWAVLRFSKNKIIQNTGLSKGFQKIKYYKIQNTELSQGFQQKGYSILGCLKVHKEFCQPNANLSKVLSKKYLAFILIFALFMCRLVWDLSKTFSSSCFENLHLLWMESGNCMQNNTLIETFPRNWFTFWWIITNYRKLFRKIKLH